ILLDALLALLSGWFGALLALVSTAGLALIGLYFYSFTFRKAYAAMFPPRGRQAVYGRNGKVLRSGWAYDESSARYMYVSKPYTRYQGGAAPQSSYFASARAAASTRYAAARSAVSSRYAAART